MQQLLEDVAVQLDGVVALQHLRVRGVVVNREVEVRRRARPGLGERTDLLVSALAGEQVEAAPIVAVIIEVKGCWHRDLKTAMDDQLAQRYLDDEGRRCGIYLALHFGPDGWTDTTDHRRAACGRIEPAPLATELGAQASALSRPGGRRLAALVIDGSQPSRP